MIIHSVNMAARFPELSEKTLFASISKNKQKHKKATENEIA
jgi:hypothetical protein